MSYMPLGKVSTNVTLPSNNIEKTASAGIKVGGRIIDYDLSLSYAYARDHLPMISDVEISPSSEAGKVDVLTGMEYPQNHILGADFAGNICNMFILSSLQLQALVSLKKVFLPFLR